MSQVLSPTRAGCVGFPPLIMGLGHVSATTPEYEWKMATSGPQVIDEPSESPPVERQQQAERNETTDFEFVDPLPPDWTCSLCLDVLKEPTLTSCGHHFCRQCIDRVIARDHVCPLCKDHGFQTLLDKATSRKINALQLYCKLKSRGCQWVGELGSLEAHIDVKKGDCEFVEVECDFSDFGCTTRLFRKDLPEHREENVHKHLVLMAVMAPRTGGGESERRIQEQRAELIQQQLQKKDEEVRRPLREKDRAVKEAHDELAKLKEEMLQQMKSRVIQLREETQDQLQQKDQEMKQGLAKLDEQVREKDTQMKEAQDELVKLKEEMLQKDEQLKHRVTELQHEMQTQLRQGLGRLENELQARNKETQQQLQDRDRQIKEVQEQLQQKDKEMNKLETELLAKDKQTKEQFQEKDRQMKEVEGELQQKIESLERRVCSCPPFEFTMTEFSKHKANNTEWFSPPFYSHPGGYKLCLAVFANGYHDGHKGSYLNSFICTMQGKYDDALSWPRRLDTTVEVFNHSTGWVVMQSFNNSERKKPTSPREMDAIRDRTYYIIHTKLAEYVKNDCLQFRIASVILR